MAEIKTEIKDFFLTLWIFKKGIWARQIRLCLTATKLNDRGRFSWRRKTGMGRSYNHRAGRDFRSLLAHPTSHVPFFYSHSTFFPELQKCDTDDDVAMCFLKNEAEFDKYITYLVGRVQAESIVVSKAVQEFYKVRAPSTERVFCWTFHQCEK